MDLHCCDNTGHREYMAKIRVQYSHVWVCRRTFDLQVHSHVALLSAVQPVGPQAEVHLWRPFNLQIQSANPRWWWWSIQFIIRSTTNVSTFTHHRLMLTSLATATFHGSLLRRSWKSSPKIDARASSSFSCWTA